MAATNASVTDPPYKEVWASLFYNNGHIEKEKNKRNVSDTCLCNV
jgi:hypothetical protein